MGDPASRIEAAVARLEAVVERLEDTDEKHDKRITAVETKIWYGLGALAASIAIAKLFL